MLSFASDYIAGAHPEILKRLTETNLENLSAYGSDRYCISAAEKIKKAFGCPEAEVRFLTGGTQTNQIVISTVLRPWEGVIAAVTGHVSTHEAGAVEFTGHKVLEVESKNGKISADALDNYMQEYFADDNYEHVVRPGMVYITFPTEYGTLYSKQELTEIKAVCEKHRLPLYIDGARLGYALACKTNDISPAEFASLCDIFYIGGTKVGALCGEAVVFNKGFLPEHFLSQTKQHGALVAKGRLFGVQFDTLFTDGLYMRISRHAIAMADELEAILTEKGYRFFLESPTNQKFIIFDNNDLKRLSGKVEFGFWETYDEQHTVMRLATSWSTTKEDIEMVKSIL